MEKVIVVIAKGRGRGFIDWITIRLFDNKKEAQSFIERVNDLENYSWTYAEIVREGEIINV